MIEKALTSSGISLIFLHGLGGCGNDWINWLQSIVPDGSSLILPTAEKSYVDLVECSCNSWFNLYSKDGSNIEELEESAKAVYQIINEEIKNGRDPRNIIGAALALYSVLTYPRKLGGLILLSGWYPAAPKINPDLVKSSYNIHTPTIHCHGTLDTKVDMSLAVQCRSILQSVFTSYQYKEMYGLGHEVNPAVQHSVAIFIKKISRSSGVIKD